ncbi:acyl-CoA dehydrogenase family protein [uncultured Ferrimonas sp.]|uniref:acyl-CoA dehydrogenase family protein n=1 Tax=uncultured Ferrimonas sp. TaxID=432640 RepID=UPI002614D1E5|nr:acyl-CoA dehydrogenase family protein [uncultured Ferrimonas sp.]
MAKPFDNEQRRAFRHSLRRYVAQQLTPNANEWDEAGTVPWHVHTDLGQLGLFGFGVDECYGGLGFDDAFMRADANIELAQCGATGIAAAVGGRGISVGLLHRLASETQKQQLLPAIVSGQRGSALAITEPSGGSDVANLQTRARWDGNHFCLNGSKTFITGGMSSDHFVVAARTGEAGIAGISLFLVEADRAGFSRSELGNKMGWWASDQATLFFDDCLLPAANLLGEQHHGFRAIMDNFNNERLAIAAQCVGMMMLCLEHCIGYSQERHTFGKPLIKHQVIRHKIADMSARTEMVSAYLDRVCWQMNQGQQAVEQLCKLKFSASKALEFVASEAMQILGGAGYMRGNPVERIYREVKIMAIGGGSEEIMRDLAVRQMGL